MLLITGITISLDVELLNFIFFLILNLKTDICIVNSTPSIIKSIMLYILFYFSYFNTNMSAKGIEQIWFTLQVLLHIS